MWVMQNHSIMWGRLPDFHSGPKKAYSQVSMPGIPKRFFSQTTKGKMFIWSTPWDFKLLF